MESVIINGVRYVPDQMRAESVRFYYMHDSHTFSRLQGKTLDEILAHADTMASKSRCGMLCSPILLFGDKEVRRLKAFAHAPCLDSGSVEWEKGKTKWREECEADPDVMRLLSGDDE